MAAPTSTPSAVILLSGGLDSSTTLALARAEQRACHCLTVQYGQRHQHELQAAQRVAAHLGAQQHLVLNIDLRPIGGSALTAAIEVPKDQPDAAQPERIPVTYVPARNTLLLSLALGWAEVIGAEEILDRRQLGGLLGLSGLSPRFHRRL